jgi:dihydrofolate reductase
MLSLIVARARNGAIGKDNEIPWHAPEDLKMFQRETTGGALIMGRRTWDSLPVRPLKNRLNCVLSRNPEVSEHVFTTAAAAIGFCRGAGYHRIYGIGGEAVYRELLPLADRLLITEVEMTIDDADAFFPDFDDTDWLELHRQPLEQASPRCTLRELIRRR